VQGMQSSRRCQGRIPNRRNGFASGLILPLQGGYLVDTKYQGSRPTRFTYRGFLNPVGIPYVSPGSPFLGDPGYRAAQGSTS